MQLSKKKSRSYTDNKRHELNLLITHHSIFLFYDTPTASDVDSCIKDWSPEHST